MPDGHHTTRGNPIEGIDTQGARIEAQITEIKAEIKAQTARIDVLQRVIWRVIWPRIVLQAVPVFGLLYRVLTTPV